MYVHIYQKSFSQEEVDSLIALYKTPASQMLLNKMPLALQNTVAEVQQLMQPVVQRIQRLQQDVLAEIQAEKRKRQLEVSARPCPGDICSSNEWMR